MTGRGLLAAARAESRWRRAFWLVVAAVLVCVPVVVTLARSSSFTASIRLYPGPVAGFKAIRDPAYYRGLLTDPVLRFEMRRNAGVSQREYADARIAPGSTFLTLTVDAGQPAEAQRLVNALGPQVAGATARDVVRAVNGQIGVLRRQIKRGRRGTATRRARLRRLRALRRVVAAPPQRITLGPAARRPPVEGWADEMVDALPGQLPARPSPVWAGLAGLLLAIVAWGIALVRVPPAPREQ